MIIKDFAAGIALVIHEPFPRFEEHRAALAAGLSHLESLSGHLALVRGNVTVPFLIRLCSASEAIEEGVPLESPPDPWATPPRVLLLDAVVPVDVDAEMAGVREGVIVMDPLPLAAALLAHELERSAQDLVLSIAIALTGAVEPTEILCRAEGQILRSGRMFGTPTYMYIEDAIERGWPPISVLPVDRCLEWLRSIPGFKEGFPRGTVGRAVAAMSHLLGFDPPSTGEALMWCMVGLEALYTDGREGISGQLVEKAQVLLGPMGKKKTFTRMYDHRSRFVHGSRDIALAYADPPGDDAVKAEIQAFEAESVAAATLVSTLQFLASRGKTDLRFRWVMEPD